MAEIIKVASLFSRFVDDDVEEDLNQPVSMGELEEVLKWFKNGSDGWTIELFLNFLNLLGHKLL